MEANNRAYLGALWAIKSEIDSYLDDGMSIATRMTDDPPDYTCLRDSIIEIDKIIKIAIAEPPRNCDMPLIVDGPADNDADKAWLAFKHHNPDAYFDVSGLLRCIDWLLAPATEQEGGAK